MAALWYNSTTGAVVLERCPEINNSLVEYSTKAIAARSMFS